MHPGGTAMKQSGVPMIAIGVAVGVVLVIVLIFGLRSSSHTDKKPESRTAAPTQVAPATQPNQRAPVQVAPETTTPEVARPNPAVVAGELERRLGRQRLWSTIEINGARIDVRSGLCTDPAMAPTLDGSSAALRNVGLTRLRCVAQSGSVVFERDL